jgi:hypothetical protein
LVPPRFNRRAEYRERYCESTFDRAFGSKDDSLSGNEGLRNLFNSCAAPSGSINASFSFADDKGGHASQDGVTGIRGNLQVPQLGANNNMQLPELAGHVRLYRDDQTGFALPFMAYGDAEVKLGNGEMVLRGSLVDAAAVSNGALGAFGQVSTDPNGALALGARYSSTTTSLGALFRGQQPHATSLQPGRAWGVQKFDSGTMGVQVTKDETDQNAPWKWQAGVLVGSTRDFQAGLRVDDSGRSASISYFQHFPFLRSIVNPLETRRVEGIVNHVDVGLELGQRFDGGNGNNNVNRPGPSLRAAASYEINKNWMVKGTLEKGKGVFGTIAFRSWTTPGFMIAATSNPFTRHLGVSIHFENTGTVRYEGVDPSSDSAQNVQDKNKWQEGVSAAELGPEWAPAVGSTRGGGWGDGQAI